MIKLGGTVMFRRRFGITDSASAALRPLIIMVGETYLGEDRIPVIYVLQCCSLHTTWLARLRAP
jgi:hypothetical protein